MFLFYLVIGALQMFFDDDDDDAQEIFKSSIKNTHCVGLPGKFLVEIQIIYVHQTGSGITFHNVSLQVTK